MGSPKKKLKRLSKGDYEDKIQQLLFRAEMFLTWSKEFYELWEERHKRCKDPREKQDFIKKRSAKYLVLHSVLYFFETASLLNSLLKRGRKDNELSFENYFALNSGTLEKQIEEVRQLYAESQIGMIRNKISDHKDINNIGDPGFHFINVINKKFIDYADTVIKKLLEITVNNFSNPPFNNYIKSFFDDSHQFAKEVIVEEIEKKDKEQVLNHE